MAKLILLSLSIAIGLLVLDRKPFLDNPDVDSELTSTLSVAEKPLEAVAALGQLQPSGDIRRLAAPLSGFGGTPRVAELLVEEGDLVEEGQVLAVFDNRPQILAELKGLRARLKTLGIEISMKNREINRYKKTALEGATALVFLEEKEDELIKLQGLLEETSAQLVGLEADFQDSELKTPITGIVLRINTRVGERPGSEGVIEVGANRTMEALIEVYESDVIRIKVGQVVNLTSENGGFKGTLSGQVMLISPQVRQRKVLSTDPTGDADARVVEVRVSLDSRSAALVKQFTGMKVIARFVP